MQKKIIIFFILLSLNTVNAKIVSINQNEIFKNIRCLICQGQSISDSNSEFAQTIKLVVRDQINSGKSEEEIYVFLTEKYGDWIIYNPPLNRENFLLWIIQYFVFLMGGFIIFFMLRKNKEN